MNGMPWKRYTNLIIIVVIIFVNHLKMKNQIILLMNVYKVENRLNNTENLKINFNSNENTRGGVHCPSLFTADEHSYWCRHDISRQKVSPRVCQQWTDKQTHIA